MDKSCEKINFGAAKIIWDEKCNSIEKWNEKMIKELRATSAKFNKGKKPKVINIKSSKPRKVSFKLGSKDRPTLKLTAPKTNKSRLSLKNYKVGRIKV